MKYALYNSNYDIHSTVTLSPYQVAHMSTKGFAFAKEILALVNDSPSWNIPGIAIEDANNRVAWITETTPSFEHSLTSGAKMEFAQDTDQQLRCLGVMDMEEG